MSFKSFLKQSARLPENRRAAISDRFSSEDGSPAIWEFRAICEKQHAKIKDSCTTKSNFKGRMETKFDGTLYINRLCTASIVEPDLQNAELQASYGVVGEEELLNTLLLPGEYATLSKIVQEINGFDREQEVMEVKNS